MCDTESFVQIQQADRTEVVTPPPPPPPLAMLFVTWRAGVHIWSSKSSPLCTQGFPAFLNVDGHITGAS